MVLNDKLALADKHATTGNELALACCMFPCCFCNRDCIRKGQFIVYVGIILMVILGSIVKSFIIHHLKIMFWDDTFLESGLA